MASISSSSTSATNPLIEEIATTLVDDRHLGFTFTYKGHDYTMLAASDLDKIQRHIKEVLYSHTSSPILDFATDGDRTKIYIDDVVRDCIGPGVAPGSDVDVTDTMPYKSLTASYYTCTRVMKWHRLYAMTGSRDSIHGEDERDRDPHRRLPAMLYVDHLPSNTEIVRQVSYAINCRRPKRK